MILWAAAELTIGFSIFKSQLFISKKRCSGFEFKQFKEIRTVLVMSRPSIVGQDLFRKSRRKHSGITVSNWTGISRSCERSCVACQALKHGELQSDPPSEAGTFHAVGTCRT